MLFWILAIVLSLLLVVFLAAPLVAGLKPGAGARPGALPIAALAALCLAPVGAFALYFQIGAPESLDPAFHEALRVQQEDPAAAIAALPPEERAAAIEAMVAGLAARLEAEPDNPDGWRMLAQSYAAMGRAAESAAAWRQAIDRSNAPDPRDWRGYANALIAASPPGEPFGEEVMTALDQLIAFNADDPLALFYLGLAARERGEPGEALEFFERLKSVVPADAPILPQLEGLIAQTQAEIPETD